MFTKTSIIENYITREIKNGNFPSGSKIPSRSALCRRFNCSRTVVEHAIDILKNSGYLAGSKGSGTYVKNTHLQDNKIRYLKIITDFNIDDKVNSLLPILNFDDLNISVEWIPENRAVIELDNLCTPGNAVISLRPKVEQIILLEKLKKRNIPVLLLNRDYKGFDYIITDSKNSIREGLSWLLIEAGREIAFVSHRPMISRPYIAERILSFYESAVELGAHLIPEWCISKNINNFTEDIAEIGQKLFGSPNIPKGIFILDADLALPVVNCGQGYGFSPGTDYKLLTFDDISELANRTGIAMMKQPDLLYAKEIRRWLNSLQSNSTFRISLKTQLKIFY